MIVSHKHRLLFIEVPLTGSWSIRENLINCYGGEPILHKHASYVEAKRLDPKLGDYFAFASVRHPADELVSRYLKYKNDPKDVFSELGLQKGFSDPLDIARSRRIRERDMSFEDYVITYLRRPFGSLLDFSAPWLNALLRYESLEGDFDKVLRTVGLSKYCSLKQLNRTAGKVGSWESYYTPRIIPIVKKNLGPFASNWGYCFPEEWGGFAVSKFDHEKYRVWCLLRRIYFTRVRYGRTLFDTYSRRLAARVLK